MTDEEEAVLIQFFMRPHLIRLPCKCWLRFIELIKSERADPYHLYISPKSDECLAHKGHPQSTFLSKQALALAVQNSSHQVEHYTYGMSSIQFEAWELE